MAERLKLGSTQLDGQIVWEIGLLNTAAMDAEHVRKLLHDHTNALATNGFEHEPAWSFLSLLSPKLNEDIQQNCNGHPLTVKGLVTFVTLLARHLRVRTNADDTSLQ